MLSRKHPDVVLNLRTRCNVSKCFAASRRAEASKRATDHGRYPARIPNDIFHLGAGSAYVKRAHPETRDHELCRNLADDGGAGAGAPSPVREKSYPIRKPVASGGGILLNLAELPASESCPHMLNDAGEIFNSSCSNFSIVRASRVAGSLGAVALPLFCFAAVPALICRTSFPKRRSSSRIPAEARFINATSVPSDGESRSPSWPAPAEGIRRGPVRAILFDVERRRKSFVYT